MASSINPYYTMNYSQPDAYRFSHDSVFLARQVFELERSRVARDWRVLDLCAGCGIVGMDFMFHCQTEVGWLPSGGCDFVEVQEEYSSHFAENVQRFATTPGVSTSRPPLRYRALNYADLAPEAQYDLVLCNPPYFFVGEGKLSPVEFKNRARFFIDSDFPTLLRVMRGVLKPGGVAYFLARQIPQANDTAVEVVGDIRGTPLLRLRPSLG